MSIIDLSRGPLLTGDEPRFDVPWAVRPHGSLGGMKPGKLRTHGLSVCAERLTNYNIVISNASYGYNSLLVD